MNKIANNGRLRLVFIITLCVFAITCFVCSFKSVNAFVMPSEIWETFDMQLTDSDTYKGTKPSYPSTGLSFTGTRNSYAKLVNEQSGNLNISLLAHSEKGSPSSVRITDANDSLKYFDIIFDTDTSLNNVRVGVNGKSYGIYHETDNPHSSLEFLGITKFKNSAGIYTRISSDSALELSFEPQTMRVYAGNGMDSLLVWDFSEEYNDGSSCGLTFDVFERYTVSVNYAYAEKDDTISTVVYGLNGVKFGAKVLKSDSVGIFAYTDVVGKVGSVYTLPAPYVSGVYSDISGKIFFEILKDNVVVADKKEYSAGEFFVPENEGTYTVRYSYGTAEFETAVVVKENLSNEIKVAGEYSQYYAVGETLTLSTCEIFTEAKTDKKAESFVTLKKEGVAVEGFVKLPAVQEYVYTFKESGEYTVEYSAAAKYGDVSETFNLTVSNDGTYFSVNGIGDGVRAGELFTVPDCYAVISGAQVFAESKIVFPSGKCYSNNNIRLTESGVYKLVYSAEKDGKTYQKEITFCVSSDAVESVSVSNATVSYGCSSVSDKISGLIVNSNNSGTITFKNPVDLSNNTKNDLLLELIVDPLVYGDRDFGELEIKITDANNADNYITISVLAPEDPRSYGGETACTVSAGVNGRERKAVAYKTKENGEGFTEIVGGTRDVGFACAMSFRGTTYFQPIERQTLKIYYDNEEKALYLSKPWVCQWNPFWQQYFRDTEIAKLIDFDDETHFNELWSGFEDGNAIVSITAKSLLKNSARYVVTYLNGVSFASEKVADNSAPVVKVGIGNGIPTAIVGMGYTLFDAYAYDFPNGKINVKAKVYYAPSGVEIEINDGKFVPYYSGDYDVVYTAEDVFGNVGVKTVRVHAVKLTEASPLTAVLGGSYATEGYVGEKINVSTVTANGGAGYIYYYSVGVTLGEESVDLSENVFTPVKAGEYVVTCTAKDYVGNTAEISYVVNISVSDKPVLNENVYIAPIYTADKTYELSAPTAALYSSDGQRTLVAPVICVSYDAVNFVQLEDNIFVPNQPGNAIIKYTYSGNNGEKLEREYGTRVVKIDKDNFDITDYFTVTSSTNAVISADSNGVLIEAEGSGATVYFVKELYSGNFSLTLKTPEGSGLNGFVLSFTDYATGKRVDLKIKGDGASSKCNVSNGKKDFSVPSVFGGNNEMLLKYVNEDRSFYYGDGSKLFSVDTFEDGSKFDGFSEYVFFSVSLTAADNGDSLIISDVSGQSTVANDGDYAVPVIIKENEFTRRINVGSTVVFPKAKGYDVLSDAGEVYLTIGGTSVTNAPTDREYRILFDKAGRYSVVYSCTDSYGNTAYDRYTINVIESVDVDFSLKTEIEKKVKAGDTITLPEAVVAEGVKATVEIFVINPDGIIRNVSGSYTFEIAGEYTVRYFVYDSNYNYAIKEYKITVK